MSNDEGIGIIVTILSSVGSLTVTTFLLKRVIDGYDGFVKETRSEITRIKEFVTKVETQALKTSFQAENISEEVKRVATIAKDQNENVRSSLARFESQIGKIESMFKETGVLNRKFVDAIKSLFTRTAAVEEEIKTVRLRLDDNHIFVKTKKD